MEQIEREYRDAMDGLRFSLEGKERIMKNLMEQHEQAPVKRRGVRPLRAALVAAAVCVALVGTAGAAQYFGVRMIDGTAGDTDMWLEGGIAYYPVESLSDELRALEGEHVYRAFVSWQEAEEFIGVELMNNPVLDASPAEDYYLHIVEEPYGIDVSGRFLVSTRAGLGYVRVVGCYEMGDVDIKVDSYLYTKRTTEEVEDWDERFYGVTFVEGTETGRETYTAANGVEVQIMTAERPSGHDTCLAAFSLNGVPFVVRANSNNGLEEAREALYQVLDGFVV